MFPAAVYLLHTCMILRVFIRQSEAANFTVNDRVQSKKRNAFDYAGMEIKKSRFPELGNGFGNGLEKLFSFVSFDIFFG